MTTIENIEVTVESGNPLAQVFVTIRASDGTTGQGEAWWGIPDRDMPGRSALPIASTIENLITPRLLGKKSGEIERHWFDLWDFGYRYADQGIFLMGMSGVDIALWDLLAKQLGIPVVQILGGQVHESIQAYASLPPLRDTDIVIAETQRAMEHGITAVKLHEVEAKYVHVLRDTFGDELEIMVDVNGHFNLQEATAFGLDIGTRGITWFEEPIRPMRDHATIKKVAVETGLPIAAGENEYTVSDFDKLLTSDAVTYLQPEITKIGGLTAAKRINPLVELYNVALSPHNFRIGPSLYASIHWAMSSPMTAWMEVPWIQGQFAGRMALPPIKDGRVYLPEGSGLGLDNAR